MTNLDDSKRRDSVEWVLIVVGFLALCVVVALTIALRRDDVGFALGGAWISLVGVLIAVAIYRRTGPETEAIVQGAVSEPLTRIEARLENTPLADEEQLYEPGGNEPPQELAVFERRGLTQFRPQQVPLYVIQDLVTGWEQAGERGRWFVGDIVAGFRRTGRRGNFSWTVAFQDPKTSAIRAWTVSRGGHGKQGPTVSEVGL